MDQPSEKREVKKQLTITEEAKQLLFANKRLGETYSEVIIRLCEAYHEEKKD